METNQFATGDKLAVTLEYNAFEKIIRPTFGMSIFDMSGTLVYGFASKGDGTSPDFISGKGQVKIIFPAISLLKGEYLISVGLLDEESVKAYDFHEKLYSITITTKNTDEGLTFMEHYYEFENTSNNGESQ